ncbi:MAG: endonuclease III [Spirochaetaceae bacterium]|jgi:endonuclease-3|nr:endonuclease III [Spirochaetaceae bacterium]
MKTKIEWGAAVRALEGWREGLSGGAADNADGGSNAAMPSVSTVAERYRQDAWAVLVSTIISLRTKDAVTLVSSRKLLGKAPTPQKLLKLDEAETAALIYPAGFYKTKAANLHKIAGILIDKYGGEPPPDMDALLALPGVGRKTANLVLIEAYGMDGICVDTHVHRISNRLGAVSTKTPEETEFALRETLPQKYWKRINALLVLYGQNVCKPVRPRCELCVITRHCAFYKSATGSTSVSR